jgi:actin
MGDGAQAVVLDNGSGVCKAGLASDKAPRVIFPSVVARPKFARPSSSGPGNDVFVGSSGAGKILNYPITHGVVANWDDMEKIYHYEFHDQLQVDPSEHPVVLTEPPLNRWFNREKTIQVLFETFRVPSFYIGVDAVLSLYSSGRNTGLVVNSGEGLTCAVPVYEGCSMPHATRRLDIAGGELTEWLERILSERGDTSTGSSWREAVRDIKEKLGYVALDFEAELQKADADISGSYTLPGGAEIVIGKERFRCPELLFKPFLNGFTLDGIVTTAFESVMNSDLDIRKDLAGNILMSGGTTMFPGLPERFSREFGKLALSSWNFKVAAPPERTNAAWIGGAFVASLETFPKMVVTREEYADEDPGIVHHRFF